MNTLIDDTIDKFLMNITTKEPNTVNMLKSELLKAILEKRVIAEVPNHQLEEMERIEAVPVSAIKQLFGEEE